MHGVVTIHYGGNNAFPIPLSSKASVDAENCLRRIPLKSLEFETWPEPWLPAMDWVTPGFSDLEKRLGTLRPIQVKRYG